MAMDRVGAYSRFVAIARVLLPVTALVLLALVFLLAKPSGGGDPVIPYAEIDEVAKDPRLTRPDFSGVTANGTVVTLGAREARPGAPALTAQEIRARLESPGGTRVEIFAGQGQFDSSTRMVQLDQLTRIETSTGYKIETNGLVADLDRATAHTTGPLEARAPFGDLSAGKLEISSGPDGAQVLHFLDGVRLIYRPQPTGEPQ